MTVNSVEDLDTAGSEYLEAAFTQILQEYGLESLAPWAAQQALNGVSEAEFIIGLESQEEYQQQFAPIFARRKAGLPPITPQMVMQYRKQMAELENFYDLPPGTLDSDGYLTDDVSYNEVQSRAAQYQTLMFDQDPATIDELHAMGVTDGNILGYVMDTERGLAAIQEQIRTADITVGARGEGFDLSLQEAQQLEGLGVSRSDAEQRSSMLQSSGDIRSGIGGEFDTLERHLEVALLSGSGAAVDIMQGRMRRLQSRFEGGGAFTRTREGVTGLGSA